MASKFFLRGWGLVSDQLSVISYQMLVFSSLITVY